MTFSSSAAGSRTSVQALAITGMFTAVLAVLSILQIPMPSGVPVTLQTFAVSLCGYVLGARRGTLCVALYLLLGIIGLPVFTGMTAGIGRIFGFTGGFLYGARIILRQHFFPVFWGWQYATFWAPSTIP